MSTIDKTASENNINYLIDLLSTKLEATSKVKCKDAQFNDMDVVVKINIFTSEQLINFLKLSLSEFNQTPIFTNFTFQDTDIIYTFADILVEGATLHALSSKSLLEKGREFPTEMYGKIYYPDMSNFMINQHNVILPYHIEKLRNIKIHFDSYISK